MTRTLAATIALAAVVVLAPSAAAAQSRCAGGDGPWVRSLAV